MASERIFILSVFITPPLPTNRGPPKIKCWINVPLREKRTDGKMSPSDWLRMSNESRVMGECSFSSSPGCNRSNGYEDVMECYGKFCFYLASSLGNPEVAYLGMIVFQSHSRERGQANELYLNGLPRGIYFNAHDWTERSIRCNVGR